MPPEHGPASGKAARVARAAGTVSAVSETSEPSRVCSLALVEAGMLESKASQPLTASDRLKRSFGARVWGGVIVATLLHLVVFAAWPSMEAAGRSAPGSDPTLIDLPPDVSIPDAPPEVARPAHPVLASDVELLDSTIPPNRWHDVPPEALPPPRDSSSPGSASDIAWVPWTVPPRLLNPEEVERALLRAYPTVLRDAGIGGSPVLFIRIDQRGAIEEVRVGESSGHESLDRAALQVADRMRFSPAQNRDQVVAVWLRLPVTFQVH